MSSPDARANRAYWDSAADEYQARHGAFIGGDEPRWGMWQLAERELGMLGDVRGRDVLELGCGAAQWSILLARAGARPVGLDNSQRQLEHARAAMKAAAVDFPLVHASAESVPLADGAFDVVFCDHGALSWADPVRVVPEAARLLPTGGVLVFSHTTPFAELFWDDEDRLGSELRRPYFGLHRIESRDGAVAFDLPQGEWIELFRRHGLQVERLLEVRPPAGAVSTYRDDGETRWARSWPMEEIWRLSKA